MGTSASSKGPGPGISFDPPWLNEQGGFELNEPQEPTEEETKNSDAEKPHSPTVEEQKVDIPVAPPARFAGARAKLGAYAREKTGGAGFREAAGHYSKTGMGGAGRLASRMRHSTAIGARLAEFLTSASAQTSVTSKAWVKDIVDRGLNGHELIDAIIQHVAPSGGSRDEESVADSMARALSEFLEKNEDSDLLDLGAADIREITECYLANEACNRLVNDIGQVLESEKVSLKDSLMLLQEMREYLRADLSVQIENIWKVTENPTYSQLDQILRAAVQHTFEVYEGEI